MLRPNKRCFGGSPYIDCRFFSPSQAPRLACFLFVLTIHKFPRRRKRAKRLDSGSSRNATASDGCAVPEDRPAQVVPEFFIKIDKHNANAEDFYVGSEILKPGGMTPSRKHHNSEEVVVLEEGGATVTVGNKLAVAGPHSSFLSREKPELDSEYRERSHSSLRPVFTSRF
jgi:mannose-6-phosphate isomerase-like protein (cupin superfamily)